MEERKNRIYAFNSHYEIYDYNIGENKGLEWDFTFFDKNTHIREPRFLYIPNTQTLYIPRGYDSYKLERWNCKSVTVVPYNAPLEPISFNMILPPRDEDEEKAIRFLTGEEEFRNIKFRSQKVLIMPTGKGKTYCTVAAIQRIGVRALLIMKTDTLKKQWIEKLKKYSDLGGPNIVELDSSSYLHSFIDNPPSSSKLIFVTTRRLLMSYCKRYGAMSLSKLINQMGIGIKVFDEVHQEYEATLQLDYILNVKWTFYLTATFKLSNDYEDRVFQNAFNQVPKLQIRQEESAKHIVYLAVLFNSHPNLAEEYSITGVKRGFDRFAYIDYELRKGVLEEAVRKLLKFFLLERKMEGKTLILSSKQSSCDYFAEVARQEVEDKYSISAFYTNNKVENYKELDILSATSQMLGTGEDIPGLRFLHNTEPFASLTNADQFSGRLRPYKDLPTFYIEYIDIGFEKVYKLYRKRATLLRTKVKKWKEFRFI